MDLYDPALLDHAKRPRNRGPLPGATHTARADNPLCGDRVIVALRLEGDVVHEARFEGRGCAVCLASASVLTELVGGRTTGELEALAAAIRRVVGPEERGEAPVPEALELFAPVRAEPSRRRCATLAWEALAAALPSSMER